MAEDDRIIWRLANPFGIWKRLHEDQGPWDPNHIDSAKDRWNAGRCMDVVEALDGSLTVAAETGGIWRMTASGGAAQCVSNSWPHHLFSAVAHGPHADEHVFAGGQALYMTNVSRPLPYLSWIELKSLYKQIPNAGYIHDILMLRGSRVIVLACDGGAIWSRIPPAPAKPSGCLGGLFGPSASALDTFVWRLAQVRNAPLGGFFSLAEGPPIDEHRPIPRDDAPILDTVMLAGLGGMGPAGLFIGRWEPGGDLVIEPAGLFNLGGDVSLARAMMAHSVVASFPGDRRIGYAACGANTDLLLMLMRTDDGGRSWNAIDAKPLGNDAVRDIQPLFGNQVNHNLAIDVSPVDSQVVAVGLRNTCISFDGGKGWWLIDANRQQRRVSDHLHEDTTCVRFAARTSGEPRPPNAFFQTSDGGVGRVGWGTGAWIIESDRVEDGQHGNLYAVVLERNELVLYVLRPRNMRAGWQREAVITRHATGAGCLIQTSFKDGDADNGNLEVVVPEGNDLVHYYCAVNQGSFTNWKRLQVITSNASSAGCIIQSSFGSGDHRNFEVVVLEGSELVHYWHDNSNVGSPWQRAQTITNKATSAGCIIQSDFPSGGEHGNFEVVVLEGSSLVHYFHDNSNVSAPWSGPVIITNAATGPARLFQADYKNDDDAHTNFELIVLEGSLLAHWIRDNSAPGFPWVRTAQITAPGQRASGPGCAFQGNFGSDETHGNFELLAPEDGSVLHYFRDNGRAGTPWVRSSTLSESNYTLRSDYNRRLANLQFYPDFGTSMSVEGLVSGPTQDTGNLYGIAGNGGTPWFWLAGGDGMVTLMLAGRCPRLPVLAAGRECVHEYNDLKVPQSAHWDSGLRLLVADDHQPQPGAQTIIPLLVPNPAANPQPAPEYGLVHIEGTKEFVQRYAVVEQPDYFPKGMVVAGIASQKSDLYTLLVDQRSAPPHRGGSLPMHWEFAITIPDLNGENPILSLASANGQIVIVSAWTNDKKFTWLGQQVYWYKFFRVVLGVGQIQVMPVHPSVGNPAANSIAMASDTEAYAIVNGALVTCWNGMQWLLRGQPALAPGEGLVDITIDYTNVPATVFAMSNRRVYASRDGANTWVDASRGLPRALICQGIRWVKDPAQSRVYLITYGRSVWVADKREIW